MRDARATSRRSGLRRSLLGGFVVATALLAAGCGLFSDDEEPVIRLYDGQYESLWLNNAIAEFIIEHGYGYSVESVVTGTALLVEEALPQGKIDLNMEGWQQNWPDYEEEIARRTIVNLGPTFEAGPQFFMIPAWVAEEYGIRTVFDMKEHWQQFQDPNDPSKGVFYNCGIGSRCGEINKVKLEAYGLARFYNAVAPASYDALAATLARAHEDRRPVFGYYWAPTALIGAYDWHILEEPAYTSECWAGLIAAADGAGPPPDQACAYESLPIDALAHSGLEQKAPDVVELVQKMNIGLEPLNETLAWSAANDVAPDWERAAIHYLRMYEERWSSWVTPEARARIKDALDDAAATS